MSLTGLKFLGCTVKNFSSNIGLENQKTSVKISLVEDRRLGDLFIPNKEGTPLSIQFGSLSFTGLLQNYTRGAGSEGLYTYEVTLEDPRDILDGCTLILGDFEGTTSVVPNLLNVYGYYESTGFNASSSNSAGMPWNMVKPAVEAMTAAQTVYGGPLNYKGYQYRVDLSGVPIPNAAYRVGGNTISLLQIISEICHDMACDFFIEFIFNTQTIKVRTISRKLQPQKGVLSAYIAAQTTAGNCIRSSVGVEARNEVCSHFLVGGQQTTIFQTGEAYQYFGQDVNNEPIIGARTDANDPFTMTGALNSLEVSDITGATTYTANMLEMCCAEFSQELWMAYVSSQKPALAALLGINGLFMDPGQLGFNALQVRQNNQLMFPLDGANAAAMSAGLVEQGYMWRVSRLHSFVKKAYDNYLGKTFLVPTRFVQASTEAETNQVIRSHDFTHLGYSLNTPLGMNAVYNSFFGLGNGQFQAFCRYDPSNLFKVETASQSWNISLVSTEENGNGGIEPVSIATIASGIPGILAQEYTYNLPVALVNDVSLLGLKFYQTGNIDHIAIATTIGINTTSEEQTYPMDDPDENVYNFKFIVTKINGNYRLVITIYWEQQRLAAETFQNIATTEIPVDLVDSLRIQLNQIGDRIALAGIFDLSRVQQDSYVFDNTSFGVYVKCSVDENLYTIPATPTIIHPNDFDYAALVTVDSPVHIAPSGGTGAEISILLNMLNIPDTAPGAAAITAATRRTASATFVPKIRNMALQPLGFAIPIQDNLNCYGPWYCVGALGKVQYEKDTSLTPWDCGSENNMNAVAAAKVSQALSFQQSQETGSFELVGAPTFNIGDAIASGGPNITNMDIGYSERGVTTTYRFHTFSNRFGVVNKSAIEQQRRINKGILDNNKKIRQLNDTNFKKQTGANNANHQFNSGFLVNQFAPGANGRSSSTIITFYSDDWEADNDGVVTGRCVNGGIMPMTEAAVSWRADDDEEFQRTASMSLDGLLRPFSTTLTDDTTLANLLDLKMSTYVEPNANYTLALTVNSLDPFAYYNDIDVLIAGDDYTTLDAHNFFLPNQAAPNTQRVVAMRGPIVISGWGYSVDDEWVPIGNTPDIYTEYQRNPQTWPTGPLEILWDGERGVWTGIAHCLGVTTGSCVSGAGVTIDLCEASGSVITGRAKSRTVYNFSDTTIPSGTKVVCVWIPEARKWYITQSFSLAQSQGYTPANTADWAGADPTTTSEALDRLATALAIVLGGGV